MGVERMIRSEHINELAAALAKAQARIVAAPKDKTAKVEKGGAALYSYKYATLAGVWEACRGPLAENGLAVVQTVTTDGAAALVTTLLAHSSGQWIEETLTMTAADASPQRIGSAITYGRRYALGAIVGVVTDDDDDGKAASDGHSGKGYRKPKAKPERNKTLPVWQQVVQIANGYGFECGKDNLDLWALAETVTKTPPAKWTDEDLIKVEQALASTVDQSTPDNAEPDIKF